MATRPWSSFDLFLNGRAAAAGGGDAGAKASWSEQGGGAPEVHFDLDEWSRNLRMTMDQLRSQPDRPYEHYQPECQVDIDELAQSNDDGAENDREGSGSIVEDGYPGGGGSGGGPNSNSSTPREPKKLQRPIVRGAQACSACRASKIKCHPNDGQPFPCRRCVTLGVVCEVLKHNRGRKRKNPDNTPPVSAPPAARYFSMGEQNGASTSAATLDPPKSSPTLQRHSDSAQQQRNNIAFVATLPKREPPAPGYTIPQPLQFGANSGNSASFLHQQQQQHHNGQQESHSNLQLLEEAIAMHRSHPPTAGSSNMLTQSAGPPRPLDASASISQRSPGPPQQPNQSQTQAPVAPQYQPGYPESLLQQPPQQSQAMQNQLANSTSLGYLGQNASFGNLPPQLSGNINQAAHPASHDTAQQALQASGLSSGTNMSNNSQQLPPFVKSLPEAQRDMPSQGEQAPSRGQSPVTAQKTSTLPHDGSKMSQEGEPGLESLKFPFLLPRDERPGRRGIFTLKSLMKSEDAEEIGPGPQPLHQSEEYLLANDPIQAGIIGLEDARVLFQLYMDEMSVLNSLIDPNIHTHDYVRKSSSFLYTAILSVISRYLNSTTYTADRQPRRLISPVYAYCKRAAQAHLKRVLGSVETSLEVVQGLTVLTYHKEVEDEKSCLHLYRAIAIAREIGLDQVTAKGKDDLSDEDRLWIRIKQRVWLSLFIANTILTMQFDMKTLIGPEDPLIAGSSRFAIGSNLPSDSLLVANVQLRRLWHIYTDMAKALEMPGDTARDKAAKLVSLSIITRTANRELEQTANDWKEECNMNGLGKVDSRINIWLAAIKLKLNLAIVQMVLPGLKERSTWSSFAPPSKAQDDSASRRLELGCVEAFHHAVNAACMILQHMVVLQERRSLAFAADTFLHFAIYAAFFLWILGRDPVHNVLQAGETEHCFTLIADAAKALQQASLYPGDSPALHARFLQALLHSRSGKSTSGDADNSTATNGGGSNQPTFTTRMSDIAPGLSMPLYNAPLHAATVLSPADPGPTAPDSAHLSQPFNPNNGALSGYSSVDNYSNATAMPNLAYDAVLAADYYGMQKDFPWAFTDFGLQLPEATANSMQPLDTQVSRSGLWS